MATNPDPATYELLFDQAREGLSRQEAALDEVRARTGTLLAASALATAFLGPPALADGLGSSGVWGLAAFTLGSILSVAILIPVDGWIFGNSVADLFSEFVEASPPLPLADIHRELAIHHAGHIERNDRFLRPLYWAFRAAAILLCAEVFLLLMDIPRGG